MDLSADDVLAEIREAFDGVTRENGVSWRETDVIDDHGSMEDRLAARRLDTDGSWKEVVTQRPWQDARGSFSFLDPIGIRYYFPAAMTLTITDIESTYELSLEHHLTLPKLFLRNHMLSQWSLLDFSQRKCVGHFLRYMSRLDPDTWLAAYKSYWHKFDAD